MAQYQSEGRGQRGSQWSGENGENLTFSILIDGSPLKNIPAFLLSKCVAISIKNLVEQFTNENVSLKWPNDVYVGTKKLQGFSLRTNGKEVNYMLPLSGLG